MKRVDQEDKKPLDFNAKLEALRYFCAYRERTQKEVKEKAIGLELSDEEWQRAIDELREGGYQDDARYAAAYVTGHFRIKGWGKNKIRHGLKFSGLPDSIIRAAIMNNIDDDEYHQKLADILKSKGSDQALTAKDRDKIIRYALQRGYEYEAIRLCLNEDA